MSKKNEHNEDVLFALLGRMNNLKDAIENYIDNMELDAEEAEEKEAAHGKRTR